MKTMSLLLILVFSLALTGCVTTQGGSGASAGSSTVTSSGGNDGKMLTEEDYKRIGVQETGTR
ncbi:MAG: hypothetical protein NPINA01_01090 [Nitrospinaceae bacterium]|nr:MAG: hypothetical protein NPINA01_01090 [Nitrospinaceae bacterium]